MSRTSRFAEYRPDAIARASPHGLTVRQATAADCLAIATMEHERDGVAVDEAEPRCRRHAADPDTLLLVATIGEEVVGFGRCGRFEPASDADADVAPPGWYLFGVIVQDRWRRHGIGRRLTTGRLAWISERASEAYYFTNARNDASLDLHDRLGFVEVTRSFTFPGATFEGGVGVLCRVDLGGGEALG